MAKRRFLDTKEEFYFVSRNEQTLPTREIILEKIEECIPYKYDIVNHQAVYDRLLMEKTTIHYLVDQVDPNRYKITLYYNVEMEILSYVIRIVGLIFGAYVGITLSERISEGSGAVGCIIGAILGGIITNSNVSQKEGEQICDKIVLGIKEYERAHLLYTSKE